MYYGKKSVSAECRKFTIERTYAVKNKLIFLIVVLACFIPSVAAYVSYQQTQNAPVDASNAVTITIRDVNEKEFMLTKEKEGDAADTLIKFFMSMKESSQPIVALPDSLMGEKFFIVTIRTAADKSESYEYYFSTDTTANYFRAHDGTTYKIGEEQAAQFITSEYAESLYEQSAMPVLTLSHTYDVTPDTAIWQYKNFTGDYVDSDVAALVSDNVESYDIEGGLDLTFDTQPDNCSVTVTDSAGNVVFDDMLDSLQTFRMSNTDRVTVDVTATWYEDPARSFCGKLEYTFTSVVTAPAEFYLGMATVDAGKFVAITALNVTKPENIQFASSMTPAIAPVFYAAEGNKAVGLLPISTDTEAGLYTLTFTYGGTTQDTVLTVANDGVKTSNYQVNETVIQLTHTQAAIDQFEATAQELMAKGSSTRYFSGSFGEGIDGDCTLLRGFGRDVYLNGSSTVSYRNNGVDYAAASGVNIVACNAGEVVYAGMLDYAGNMVVIEHGYGLKTWYYNLGSCNVSVGDIVEKGAVIGTAGQTGFTGSMGAHIAMTVGSTFVSPYDTWADSPVAAKVIIAKIDE